jgi:hypothetical protein
VGRRRGSRPRAGGRCAGSRCSTRGLLDHRSASAVAPARANGPTAAGASRR